MRKPSKKQLEIKKRVLKDITSTIDIYMKGTTYKDDDQLMESITYNTLVTLLSIYGLESVNATIRQALGCYVDQTNDELIEHPEFFTDPIEVGKDLIKVKKEIELLEDFDDLSCCDDVCNDCKAKAKGDETVN